jgi:hypothetical protein
MGNCANLVGNINMISERAMGFYPDKVFPEEVDNIKDFMHDTFTTNINGYSLSEMEKLKAEQGNYSNQIQNNFLQQDEMQRSIPNFYDNQLKRLENFKKIGIDSSSLNRNYFNGRTMKQNFENENYQEFKNKSELKRNEKSRIRSEERSFHSNLNNRERNNKLKRNSNDAEKTNNSNAKTNITDSRSEEKTKEEIKIEKNKPIEENKKQIRVEEEEMVNNHKILRRMI